MEIEYTDDGFAVTGTKLLDLNDDCLYDIFALKHVNLMDLCSVAESCSRLKCIAIRIFAASYKSYNLKELCDIHEMRRFLYNFGSSITELTIGPSFQYERRSRMWVRVLDLIVRYCSKTLESLKLEDYEITEFLTGKLRSMFGKLKKLQFSGCFFDEDCKALFSNCVSLVELKVIDSENDDMGMIFENQFPKLEHFKYEKERGYYYNYKLEVFVSRHPALKTFVMKGDCSSLLPVIADRDRCENLEELQVTSREGSQFKHGDALQSLLTLTKLTKLKLKFEQANTTEFVKNLTQLPQLEFLELWHVQSDAGFVPALSQLKNLAVLRLRHCRNLKNINSLANLEKLNELSILLRSRSTDEIEFDVIEMIKRLVHLKKLTVGLDLFKIDQRMYLKMVNVVRERASRSPSSLEVKINKIEANVADLQKDGRNIETVKLDALCFYDSDDEDMFWEYNAQQAQRQLWTGFVSRTKIQYNDYDDDDYDDDDYDDDDYDDDDNILKPLSAYGK